MQYSYLRQQKVYCNNNVNRTDSTHTHIHTYHTDTATASRQGNNEDVSAQLTLAVELPSLPSVIKSAGLLSVLRDEADISA